MSVKVPPRSTQNSHRPSRLVLAHVARPCLAAQPAPYPVAGSISPKAACTSAAVTVVRSAAVASLAQAHDPDVPAGAGTLEQGPGEPAVAQLVDAARRAGPGEDGGQHLGGLRVEHVSGPAGHQLDDPDQVLGLVAGEADPGAEARGQARVAAQEPVHVAGVAGQHDDQPVAVILGPLEQGLDRLGPERVTAGVALVVQRVGLVDEQHAAQRRVDQPVGLDRGRAEVLADQVGPVRLDHLGPHQQPEGGEDPAQDAGDRGLAGAGRPGEDEVPGGRLADQPVRVPQLGHAQLGDDGADLLLDRLQADQLVQLGDRALDGGRVLVAAQPAGQLGVGLLQVSGAQGDQVVPRRDWASHA